MRLAAGVTEVPSASRVRWRRLSVLLMLTSGLGGTSGSLLELAFRSLSNRLAEQPKWYNALTHNCTTVIRDHAKHVALGGAWNWRILLNGRLDELGYMRKNIDTSLPFSELRERSRINPRAMAAGNSVDFSARIREGLPAPRAPR